jgi:hypothetical protein
MNFEKLCDGDKYWLKYFKNIIRKEKIKKNL